MDITIGSHQVVLKAEVLKKDIIPLSRLNALQENGAIDEEALTRDPALAIQATDILVEVFVVSIDGKTSRGEVKEVVDNMTIAEFNELTVKITENMKEFEKKSPISSTSTKSISSTESENSQKNG